MPRTEYSDVNAVIRLLELLVVKSDPGDRQIALKCACSGNLAGALGKFSIHTMSIMVWQAAKPMVERLEVEQIAYVSRWAGLRLDLLEATDEIVRYASEHTRYTDWLLVRECFSTASEDIHQNEDVEPSIKDLVEALRERKVPISLLHYFVQTNRIDWNEDSQSVHKAYVMACWAELSYLQLSKNESPTLNRYKVYEPSIAQTFLAKNTLSLPLEELVPLIAEYRVQVLVRKNYLYIIADMWGAVVVAVRGTRMKSVEDWTINFTVTKALCASGYEHAGFAQEADFAEVELRNIVQSRTPIYFTGHSMGAAVAALLTRRFQGDSDCKTPYLFACPRFEGGIVEQRVKAYSYVQPRDIVPHVPLKLQGYSSRALIQTVLPEDERQRGLGASLLYWALTLNANQHSMEIHRRLVGVRVNQHHADTAYVDAVMDAMKGQRG